MTVTWHSFDLRTGRRGPQLVTQQLGTVSRIIGEATETTISVSCWDAMTETPRPEWDAATLPGRTMLVALDDDEQPVWGAMVYRRVSHAGQWVDVSATTLESYLDRRFAGDLTFVGVDQVQIVAGVIGSIAVDGINLTIDATNTGILRDRSYFDDEDKTVLSVLQDLMGVEDGPELTVDLEWADTTRTVLRRVVRVRQRIGRSLPVPVQFVMPGPVTDFEFVEDYSTESGANDILATSSGEGDVRPESQHQVATDLLAGGWARFESRFSPSTSITDTATLDDHAREQLAVMREGLRQITLTANLDAAPKVGVDWFLGDDITAVLTCPRFPAYLDGDGRMVPGYSRTVRCVGWEIDFDAGELKPTVVEVD